MKKEIISGVVVSVVTAAVLGVGAWFMGVFESGSEAQAKELIRAVLEEELETDTVLETRVTELKDDVEDLEDIALDLAGGN
jgi:cell shape-determining protein MreC